MIRAIALTENSASMCMQRSNNILCQESVNDMFVTVFYGILNIHTGTVTYSNAGHNPPILMKKDGSVSKVPSTGDMILGAINDASYHEKELKMSPGDNLFLYTDGVTEAMNTKHELYSETTAARKLPDTCRKEPERGCGKDNRDGWRICRRCCPIRRYYIAFDQLQRVTKMN